MKTTHAILFATALALCLCLGASARETKIKADQVPAPARAAAAKAYPHAEVKEWEQTIEGGKTLYEVTMAEGKATWQAVFAANGAQEAREEVVPVSSLPAAVRDAVKAKYPKAALSSAEKITRPSSTEYEVGLKNAPMKEVVVTAEGKILAGE